MARTAIQKTFAPVKQYLPSWLANFIRKVATAFLTPVLFSYQSGHFRSSIRAAAESKDGQPLPWYTYPSIDFLKLRTFKGKTVLEFGGGQSTLWWAQRAEKVVTLEGDREWYSTIADKILDNVELYYVSMVNEKENISQVKNTLSTVKINRFDVIVIDGLYRNAMIDIACDYLSDIGIIICDNAEGYGFYESFRSRGMNRVDFYGLAPGIILPHCTSIYFTPTSFVFDSHIPIRDIAKTE